MKDDLRTVDRYSKDLENFHVKPDWKLSIVRISTRSVKIWNKLRKFVEHTILQKTLLINFCLSDSIKAPQLSWKQKYYQFGLH